MLASLGNMPSLSSGGAKPDPWDVGAALDFFIQPFEGVCRIKLGPVIFSFSAPSRVSRSRSRQPL